MSKITGKLSRQYLEYLNFLEDGDIAKARENLLIAATLNDPFALHALGYEAETASNPNLKVALNLYRKAARLGHEPSMINLARFYEERFNHKRYFHWIRKSAEIGSEESWHELKNPFPYLVKAANAMRCEGRVANARHIYKYCARHGSIDAMINFANIIDICDKRKNRKLSERLYRKAAEGGSGLAAFNLANHYAERGDVELSTKYMHTAAKLGYAPARNETNRKD
jgi:TPR repeat protein